MTPRPTAITTNQTTQSVGASITDDADSKKLFETLSLEEKADISFFFKAFASSDQIVKLKCERNKLPVGLAHSCEISIRLSDEPNLKTQATIIGTTLQATLDAQDSAFLSNGNDATASPLQFVSHDAKAAIDCKGEGAALQCSVSIKLK